MDEPHQKGVCRRCILRFLGICTAILLVLGIIAWFARAPLLTALTTVWVVDEAPIQADAVVVLGGGVNTRTIAAAEAYQAGLVGKVLLTRTKPTPVEALGLVSSHPERCHAVVVANQVPPAAIELIGEDVTSTWEEAEALKGWARDNQATTILIPTEFVHTRRVRWVMNKTFRNSPTRVVVMAIEPLEYNRASWWTDEDGLVGVQNEVLKYLFYRLNY